jgi:hypothetical protein
MNWAAERRTKHDVTGDVGVGSVDVSADVGARHPVGTSTGVPNRVPHRFGTFVGTLFGTRVGTLTSSKLLKRRSLPHPAGES